MKSGPGFATKSELQPMVKALAKIQSSLVEKEILGSVALSLMLVLVSDGLLRVIGYSVWLLNLKGLNAELWIVGFSNWATLECSVSG